MSNIVSIMCVPFGFKIRKKADVEYFINKCMHNGSEYFIKIQNDFALIINKEKDGTVSIAEKRWDLYDPFNPMLEVANTSNSSYKHSVEYYIWKYRKYINAKWFND